MAEPPRSRSSEAHPRITYPEDLPIVAWRDEILGALARHQVIIVAGETGSGKSTQLPKMCLEAGLGDSGLIGHTQPRRIAARSIAERVASELGAEVGGLVGYSVRFTDRVDASTRVRVMTDGILLNELQRDPRLSRYSTIIIDEAHERSLNIDFLLGYLHQLLPRRLDLKVIITSATIDTERFAEHFGAPVIEVEGRTYPVEVRYRPLLADNLDDRVGEPRDQTQAICDAVTELAHEGQGDVLVFCAGEREIRDAVDALTEMGLRHTEVLPLFGRLTLAEQHRVFASHTGRRIVVATNVAETSLTVPGIRYVVDTGMARISRFSRRTKVQQLPIEPISKASAAQRAGRCGRLGPGVCIRLYDEDDHEARPEFTDPEIRRTNLASVMLQMAALGLGDIEGFPFIEPPDTRSIKDGVGLLHELGAITDAEPGTRKWLTPIGVVLARLPLDPRLGRMILAGNDNACLDEVLTIVSALAIQDPRERPTGKEEAADQMHRRFMATASDLTGLLALWAHIRVQRDELTSNQFRTMCRKEYLNWRRVREWQDVRAQLRRVVADLGMTPNREPSTPELIHESVLAGILSHVGKKDPDGWGYRGARGMTFSIRPGSVLFKAAPEWVMAAELVTTTRTWAAGVAAIDPAMIERVGSHLITRTLSDPWWDAPRGSAVARETVTLLGMTISSDRVVQLDRFDPDLARRLFIRHALVAGEWETHHAFAAHNEARISEVIDIETRERREDLLIPDDELAAIFDLRIPDEVTSVATFDRWWRDARSERPDLLDLTIEDLIAATAASVDEDAFPAEWDYGDLVLDLAYEFDTSSDSDGLTVDIPVAALDRIDPTVFEWTIPGFRADLIDALLRSLPKDHRRRFAPLGATSAELADRLDPTSGPLLETLARELTRAGGHIIAPDDFDPTRVPDHLWPRFRIVEGDGTVVAEGRDLTALRSELRDLARAAVGESGHPLERDGIVAWDFGSLPDAVVVSASGHPVTVYPALVAMGDSVSIRLVASSDEQAEEMWAGLRNLILINLPSPDSLARAAVGATSALSITASPYMSFQEFLDDVLGCALDLALADDPVPWEESAFRALLDAVRNRLPDSLETVGPASSAVLAALDQLAAALDTTPPQFADVISDVEEQMDRIIFPGFLTAVGASRLTDVRRYVDGATWRLTKVVERPDRDRERMARVRALEEEHDRLTELLAWSPELVDIAWMLQELRVSLFAQPIGASGPVSEKRIRTALDALLR
ncbi:MAG TPA: ATP-dependent RNA helicase HrpA [Acidimicrobiia bacterium]|nr:ATP-dependent RNA helicase HrpA [Acidimicrobiia bacterium]